jgi:hypothetical protein
MYARDAIRRLARRGIYPATKTELDSEIAAMREEIRERRDGTRIAELEARIRRLEGTDEVDPYR